MPRPKLQDEFTNLPVPRQRKWQLRQLKNNKCITCGKPAENSFCLLHKEKRKDYNLRNKYKTIQNKIEQKTEQTIIQPQTALGECN